MVHMFKFALFKKFRSPRLLTSVDFARMIAENKRTLIDRFIDTARAAVPHAGNENRAYIEDHLPEIVDRMIGFLAAGGSRRDYLESQEQARKHGRQRAQHPQYEVTDIRNEFSILRELLLALLTSDEVLDNTAVNLFAQISDSLLSHATEEFVRSSTAELQQQRKMQVVLETSRDELSGFFKQLPLPAAVVNYPDLRFMLSNPAFENLLASESKGKFLTDVFTGPIGVQALKSIEEVVVTGTSVTSSERLWDSENDQGVSELRYLTISYTPLRDGENQVNGILIYIHDVTDEVKGRNALSVASAIIADEQSNLKELFEKTHEFFAIMGGAEHRFEYTNAAHRALFNGDDHTGRALAEAQPELIGTVLQEILDRVYRTGIAEQLDEVAAPIGKTTRYLSVIFAPRFGADRNVTGVIALGTDITAQVEATSQAEARRKELHDFFMQAPAPLCILMGPEFLFTVSNPLYNQLIGRNPLGQTIREAFTAEEVALFLPILEGVFKTGQPYIGKELDFTSTLGHDSSPAKLNLIYQPFKNEQGETIGIFAFIQDVTEQVLGREAAENQQKWFEDILNQLPTPLLLFDPKSGTTTFSNEAAERIFVTKYTGVKPHDVYGQTVHLSSPNGTPWTANQTPSARAIRGEELVGEEFIAVTPKGRFHLRAFSEQIPEKFGHETAALLLLQDVTEAKTAEDRLRTLADSMPQIVWSAGPDGILDYTNEKWAEYSGSSEPSKWLDFVHPEDIRGAATSWTASVQTGQHYKTSFRLKQQRDGKYRWHLVRALASLGADGQVERWYGSCTDIDDEKSLAEELTTAQDQLEFAMHSARIASWHLDLQTGQVTSSSNTSRLLADEDDEIAGDLTLLIRSLVHPDDKEQVAKTIQEAVANDSKYQDRYRMLRRDGSIRWSFSSGRIRKNSAGRPVSITGILMDITEEEIARQQIQEAKLIAESANAAKSQFLANMSHEIRTPLGAIMGFVSLLKDEGLSRHDRDGFISVVERNSSQLLRIIDDILDLSKVEAGMMVIEEIDFALPELLTDFSSLMGFTAREKGILFVLKALTPLPRLMTSDPMRIRQILMNVVGNAIKFTDSGRVELNVSCLNNRLEFEVKDTGRGITREQEEGLFQPFSQADTSITRKYGGTGLGLVLTRRLAEAMGGSFKLRESKVGVGSVFVAEMKVIVAKDAELISGLGFTPDPVRTAVSLGQLADIKVLLVEDSPDNQALISFFLSRAGARVEIASDGQQGRQKASAHVYDIVLMDVQMPVLDGISAVRLLRADGYKVPVIALTAHAMKEERIRCLQAGYTDFLSKPVTREDLIEIILRHLKKS